RQLPPRADVELLEDVREMRAHGARRDAECLADLLVRLAARDEAGDLELALGESRDPGAAGRAGGGPGAELADLLTRPAQLALRAQPGEDVVRVAQLA